MNFRKRITASFGARSVRMGLYSAAVTVMVLAILIGVNTFMGALPSDATVIDLTADSLFTLSQQSKDLMRSLDKDVTMYWIVQTGVEDDTVENLLDRYSGNSSHIETVKLDPDLNPTFIKNYPDEEMNNNGVLVVCGERYRYVDIEDIYTETFSYETYDYIYEFDGEKLREVKAKLNKDEDAYEWTSSKLTTYVVSDAKLKADEEKAKAKAEKEAAAK